MGARDPRVTFECFIENVDAVLRARARSDYGLYVGPHVAFWQRGPISARVREGTSRDVELDVPSRGVAPLRTSCDALGAQRVAEAIVASWP